MAGYRAGYRDAGRVRVAMALRACIKPVLSPGPRPVALIVITRQDGHKI